MKTKFIYTLTAEQKKKLEKFCPNHNCWWQNCGCTRPKAFEPKK